MNLLADCSNCFGLCCVALPFAKSSDFAMDKDAAEPCRNLQTYYSCRIHAKLRSTGFKGCTVYDCFGAGQKVSQETFDGRSWREDTDTARQMFDVFPVMRQLHELLWYLTEAIGLDTTTTIATELQAALNATVALTDGSPEDIASIDVGAHRGRIDTVLTETSEFVRARVKGKKKNYHRSDLIGKQLAGADLRGANFRGACLIATVLRGADLRFADLIGADLRDANLGGADLRESLFLTQFQINAAQGNSQTRIPTVLIRPSHWD